MTPAVAELFGGGEAAHVVAALAFAEDVRVDPDRSPADPRGRAACPRPRRASRDGAERRRAGEGARRGAGRETRPAPTVERPPPQRAGAGLRAEPVVGLRALSSVGRGRMRSFFETEGDGWSRTSWRGSDWPLVVRPWLSVHSTLFGVVLLLTCPDGWRRPARSTWSRCKNGCCPFVPHALSSQIDQRLWAVHLGRVRRYRHCRGTPMYVEMPRPAFSGLRGVRVRRLSSEKVRAGAASITL